MAKRILSAALALILVVGLLPAAGAAPAASAAVITTVEEFEAFRDAVGSGRSYEGEQVVLAANLDLAGSETNPWVPVTGFKGTFDGQNHTLCGLYLNSAAANQGLFASLPKGSTVKNLTVGGRIRTTANSAGGIAGTNSGTIEHCRSTVTVDGSGGSFTNFHGGIAGDNYKGTITGCVNDGAILGVGATGGIAGRSASADLRGCYNTGAVTGAGGQTGGIVGQMRNMGSPSAVLDGCYSRGAVSGGTMVGGVVGQLLGGAATSAYYLTGTCPVGVGSGTDTAVSKTAEALKALVLGAPFVSVPDGYPALEWEASTDSSAPVGPIFLEKTALSKALSGYLRGAVNSKKTAGGQALTDSLLGGYTQSSTDTDWIAVAMARYGYFEDGSYRFLYDDGAGYAAFLAALPTYITDTYAKNGGLLDPHKATEWQRVILTINALGGDPTSFGTYNGAPIDLVRDGTYHHPNPGWQGINGLIFGLLALDSKDYAVPTGAITTRSDLIEKLLALQLSDGAGRVGGWALTGSLSDPDISAMVIQALTPYYTDSTLYTYTNAATKAETTRSVRQAVDMALERLSALQRPEGDFASWGTVNCESTAQVLTALCGLGLDPATDPRFLKNGRSVWDGLLRYRLPGGGFTHAFSADPQNPSAVAGAWNSMATDQAACALAAYWRMENGMRRLYDMREEFSSSAKALLEAATAAISALPAPGAAGYKSALKAALARCRLVPATERSYIGNYGALAAAIDLVGGEGELDTETVYATALTISTPPVKTAYVEEELFDSLGMVVTLTYSDATTAPVTGYTVSPATPLGLADTSVVVRWGVLKAELPITVREKALWAGEGTEAQPYLLGTAADLQGLCSYVNVKRKPTLGLHFKMTADIDLGSVAKWPSIGTSSSPFEGTFHGEGHRVSSLTGANGFFGTAGDSATIEGLGVASGTITGTGGGDRGGVVGTCNGADLLHCWNGAAVAVGAGGYSGGVVGAVRGGTGGTISGCYNVGTVTGDDQLGGIVGYIGNQGSGTIFITDCYNAGSVSGTDGIGGIVGKNQGELTLQNCYNVGELAATSPSFAGIGSLVGGAFGTLSIRNSYYPSWRGLAGTGKGDLGAAPKTAAELRDPALLGAAFRADSAMENGGYPLLAWQPQTPCFRVTFTASPAACELVVRNGENSVMPRRSDGDYLLPAGSYTYLASAPGYYTAGGNFTVTDAPCTLSVTLKSSGIAPPPATGDTIEATLTDGLSQRGSRRTFDVVARDKNGTKIPVLCTLNGAAVRAGWDDDVKTSFTLVFTREGANTVELRAGGAAATYTIYYRKAAPGTVIGRVAISVEAFTIGGGYLIPPCYAEILEGENAAQLLARLLGENGFSYRNTGSLTGGFYLTGLQSAALTALPMDAAKVPAVLLAAAGNSFGPPSGWRRGRPDTLGEFDYTRGSGWMYCSNGAFPNVGFADYYLSDGDVFRVQYTLAYGADIGGGLSAGGRTGGYYPIANKDALTALLAEKGLSAAPKAVLDTVEKVNATQQEVDSALALLESGALPVPPEAALKCPNFTDVKEGDWYCEAVRYLAGQGLFLGTSETTFSPEAQTSRATLWTVLYRRAGSPGKTAAPLWYADAQRWAIAEGISDGTRPDAPVSRQELAATLYRAQKAKEARADLTAFSDCDRISDWALPAMAWAVTGGILTGRTHDRLDPLGTASRAEVATVLWRIETGAAA